MTGVEFKKTIDDGFLARFSDRPYAGEFVPLVNRA